MQPALWKHQAQAVAFAEELPAALWHMGMGTGKSRCAIELARRMNARRILILCPKSVCAAWREQVATFGGGMVTATLDHGSVATKKEQAKRIKLRAEVHGDPVVVVVNYESARREPLAAWLLRQQFDLLVLDESHRIKSPSGSTSRWVSRLAKTCGKRVALTGTPMPHSPLDIYAQFRALKPEVFGTSFVRFRERYARMGGFQGKQVMGFQNVEDLQARMARYTFQADRSVLQLPEATHTKIPVTLRPKARQLYDDLDRDFVAQVLDGEITAANAMVKLLRLQQVTSGRVPISGDHAFGLKEIDTAKKDALKDLLSDLEHGEPVVIFGRFAADLLTVHDAAKACGLPSLELSGQTNRLAAWQRGEAPILAVQIQSGGTGIDLTRARYCCYLSTGFSLGDYEQSLARVHRPGQGRTVSYYHFVASASVDEQVYDALRQRKQVVETVLDGIKLQTPTTRS